MMTSLVKSALDRCWALTKEVSWIFDRYGFHGPQGWYIWDFMQNGDRDFTLAG
jgi:hypothetical protein